MTHETLLWEPVYELKCNDFYNVILVHNQAPVMSMGELSPSSTAWRWVASKTCNHFTRPKGKVLLSVCKIMEMAQTLWWTENMPLPGDKKKAMYNVTLRHIHSLLQRKTNMYDIFWVCVCRIRYPACSVHAPYCHVCTTWLYNILPHHLINGTI